MASFASCLLSTNKRPTCFGHVPAQSLRKTSPARPYEQVPREWRVDADRRWLPKVEVLEERVCVDSFIRTGAGFKVAAPRFAFACFSDPWTLAPWTLGPSHRRTLLSGPCGLRVVFPGRVLGSCPCVVVCLCAVSSCRVFMSCLRLRVVSSCRVLVSSPRVMSSCRDFMSCLPCHVARVLVLVLVPVLVPVRLVPPLPTTTAAGGGGSSSSSSSSSTSSSTAAAAAAPPPQPPPPPPPPPHPHHHHRRHHHHHHHHSGGRE